MKEELLRMEGIGKSFPGVKALDDVSLTVHSGEVHALLGENGAGKSTLIKILNGVYTPDAGEIYIRGKKVTIRNVAAAQHLKIGIIFQELNLCPDLNVADNVFINRQMNKFGIVQRKTVEEKTQRILDQLELPVKPTDLVKDMGISKKQMVEIAKAMSFDSDIIVFDEPTASLTKAEIETLFRIIIELKNRGKGIIYISHRLEELARIADRITILRDGKKVGESFKYEDVSLNEIISMMVGRSIQNIYPMETRTPKDIFFEVHNVKSSLLNVEHLAVRCGEIVGIAGLIGSGRSELARAIFGADQVDSIEITMNGNNIHIRTPADAIKYGIAYLTEDRKGDGLALSMDCEKNINMASWAKFSHLGIVKRPMALNNAQKHVSSLRIKTPKLTQPAMYLSGGNQQKLVVAKWLSCDARLMIFDEPTRGIDVGAKYEIYKMMNDLCASGVGIIMISSDLPEVLGMSDRIYTMCNGTIVSELQANKTSQEEILSCIAGYKNLKANKTNTVGGEKYEAR